MYSEKIGFGQSKLRFSIKPWPNQVVEMATCVRKLVLGGKTDSVIINFRVSPSGELGRKKKQTL